MNIQTCFATLALTGMMALPSVFANNLRSLEFPDLRITGEVNTEKIAVYFNPKEYTITKSTPWKHHNIQGLDAPTLEFTSGEPYRIQFELFFDRYEEGKSVREVTDKIEKLALVHQEVRNVTVSWGDALWVTTILSAKTQVTDILPDGTPVAATMHVVCSDLIPAARFMSPPAVSPATLLLPDGDKVACAVNADAMNLVHLIDPPLLVGAQELKIHSANGLTPKVSFAAGEPYRLQLEVILPIHPKQPTDPVTARLQKLAQANTPIEILLGGAKFKCILESFSQRFTLFLDDGTPVRAVMNAVFKEFSPAEDQLKGNPRH